MPRSAAALPRAAGTWEQAPCITATWGQPRATWDGAVVAQGCWSQPGLLRALGKREARRRAAGAAPRGPGWLLGESFDHLEAAHWESVIREGAEYLSVVNFETGLTRFGICQTWLNYS